MHPKKHLDLTSETEHDATSKQMNLPASVTDAFVAKQ